MRRAPQTRVAWKPASPAWKLDADNPHLASRVDRTRRAELGDSAGAIGIAAAVVGLIWMLGKCGPTLLPGVFQ